MKPPQMKSDFFSRIGLDRNRLIAVVSLLLVLTLVLVFQFTGAASEPVVKARQAGLKRKEPGKADSGQHAADRKRPVVAGLQEKTLAGPERGKAVESSSQGSDPTGWNTVQEPFRSWPEVDVKDLDLLSPFELPVQIEELKKEKAELERQMKLAEEKRQQERAARERQARIRQSVSHLQQQGIRLVYLSGPEKMVQIGDRIAREGDVIDGVRVSEIRSNGSVILDVVEFRPGRLADDQPGSGR